MNSADRCSVYVAATLVVIRRRLRKKLATGARQSAHVVTAAVTAAAISMARGFVRPPLAPIVSAGGALLLSGIAASAIVRAGRQHSARARGPGALELVSSTTRAVAPRYPDLWAARVLLYASNGCDLGQLAGVVSPRRLARAAVDALVAVPARRVRLLEAGLTVSKGLNVIVLHASFVRDCEGVAATLHARRAPGAS